MIPEFDYSAAVGTRDRTPRPPQSRYITPEGAARLRDELTTLWTVERPKVTQEVADAAAQGDRSENAEYIYGKRRLREIDRRGRFPGTQPEEGVLGCGAPSDPDREFFGARVRVVVDGRPQDT